MASPALGIIEKSKIKYKKEKKIKNIGLNFKYMEESNLEKGIEGRELNAPEKGWECEGNIKEDERARLIIFRLIEKRYPQLGVKVCNGHYSELSGKCISVEGQSIWVDPQKHTKEVYKKIAGVLDNPVFEALETQVKMAYTGPEIILGNFDELFGKEMKRASINKEMKDRVLATIAAWGLEHLKKHPEVTKKDQPGLSPEERKKMTIENIETIRAWEEELRKFIESGINPYTEEEIEELFNSWLEKEFSSTKRE